MKVFIRSFRGRLILMSLIVLFIAGCALGEKASIEGYVLHADEERILVAYDITLEQFDEISKMTVTDISNSDEYLPLIYVSYNKTYKFNVGDRVQVWIHGGINDSYPQQAGARKIKVIN